MSPFFATLRLFNLYCDVFKFKSPLNIIRVFVPDEDEEDEETFVAVWKTSDMDIVPLTIDRIECVSDLLAIRDKLI